MGTRRRFLYRLIVYPLLPLLALYIALSHLGDRDSALLGLLGLILGLTALYLFFGRLKRPLTAIRYAVNPARTVQQALGSWVKVRATTSEKSSDLQESLQAALPDVPVKAMSLAQTETACLRVGDELFVCVGPRLQTMAEAEALAGALEEARTPLQEEAVLLVLSQPTDQALLARMQERLPRLSFMEGS
jgi:hypothetical protein